MDVLRVLSSPNMDIRRKTLDIALDLITPRNIDEVVLTLKKEVVKTQNKELEKVGEYRQMLVQVRLLLRFLSGIEVASEGSFVWLATTGFCVGLLGDPWALKARTFGAMVFHNPCTSL